MIVVNKNVSFYHTDLLLSSMKWDERRKMRYDLVSTYPIVLADFECSLQDQLHLERENGIEMKMENYLLLAYRQFCKMHSLHTECCLE